MQTPNTTRPIAPFGKPAAIVAVIIITLIYLLPMTWDFFAWAIYGTAFFHSPRYHDIETHIIGLGSTGLMLGFIGIDKGFELIKQNRPGVFLIAFLTVIGSGLPAASFTAALYLALRHKGIVVVTHPRFITIFLITALMLACKFRAIRQYFRMMHPDVARLLHADTGRLTIPSADDAT